MSFFPFKVFSKNILGRDFIVGDIHGMFSLLESQLESLNFDPECDRVFSVGDLIDRGPESYRILEFLDKPWFHSIRGNHEVMLLEAKHKNTTYQSWIKKHGGAWWEDIDPDTQQEIRERLSDLPIALEVSCNLGKVGVVHADVPVGLTWKNIVQNLHNDKELQDYLTWSRNRYKYFLLTGETATIEGVDLVVIGHTPIEKPLKINNVYFIDTGAAFLQKDNLGYLTLLQVHPKLEEFRYPKALI